MNTPITTNVARKPVYVPLIQLHLDGLSAVVYAGEQTGAAIKVVGVVGRLEQIEGDWYVEGEYRAFDSIEWAARDILKAWIRSF